MKKPTILICALAILLVCATAVSASPHPPQRFRIVGVTTQISLEQFPPYIFLQSAGKAIRHLKGTFIMDETVIPTGFESPSFINNGTLTLTTKDSDRIVMEFAGTSEGETVHGNFWVTDASSAYQYLRGGGTYAGIADNCVLPCDPFSDPNCGPVFEMPDCDGFYVDFTFTYWE